MYRYEWVESRYAEAVYESPEDAALLWGFAQLLTGPGLRVDRSPARRTVNIRRSVEFLSKALQLCPRSAKVHVSVGDVQSELKKVRSLLALLVQ